MVTEPRSHSGAVRHVYPFELAGMVRGVFSAAAHDERVMLARLPESLTDAFPLDVARQVTIACGAYVCFDLPERAEDLRVAALHLRFASAGRPATLSLWDANGPLAVAAPVWERSDAAGPALQMWLRFVVPVALLPVRPPLHLYLPYDTPVELLELQLESASDAPLRPLRVPAAGKRWIAYGDSITLGRLATDPALTYPTTAARALGLECWNLGFGGSARAEPPVALALAALPCDVLSLAIGTNVYTPNWYDPTAWQAAFRNFLDIIRGRRPDLPLVVVSQIFFPGTGEQPERTPNQRGLTAAETRHIVETEVERRLHTGDTRLRLVRGLDVIGASQMHLMADHAHPNDAGYAALSGAVASAISSLLEE